MNPKCWFMHSDIKQILADYRCWRWYAIYSRPSNCLTLFRIKRIIRLGEYTRILTSFMTWTNFMFFSAKTFTFSK